MSAGRLSLQTQTECGPTISARGQLLQSFRDPEYRRLFVEERLRASVALQIRALRQQHEMTQAELGKAIGMAQTWISKLEDPDYGKMTVATLLRLAGAYDADLEIKFRPFSKTLDSLPTQGPEYFHVPTFEEEFGQPEEAVAPTTVGTLETLMRATSGPPTHRRWIHLSETIHGEYQSGPYGQMLESQVMVGNQGDVSSTTPRVARASSIRKPPMQELTGSLGQTANLGR